MTQPIYRCLSLPAPTTTVQTLTTLMQTISQVWTQSQIDTADNPENLEFIGWGPRATTRSIEAPGRRLILKSIDEGSRV